MDPNKEESPPLPPSSLFSTEVVETGLLHIVTTEAPGDDGTGGVNPNGEMKNNSSSSSDDCFYLCLLHGIAYAWAPIFVVSNVIPLLSLAVLLSLFSLSFVLPSWTNNLFVVFADFALFYASLAFDDTRLPVLTICIFQAVLVFWSLSSPLVIASESKLPVQYAVPISMSVLAISLLHCYHEVWILRLTEEILASATLATSIFLLFWFLEVAVLASKVDARRTTKAIENIFILASMLTILVTQLTPVPSPETSCFSFVIASFLSFLPLVVRATASSRNRLYCCERYNALVSGYFAAPTRAKSLVTLATTLVGAGLLHFAPAITFLPSIIGTENVVWAQILALAAGLTFPFFAMTIFQSCIGNRPVRWVLLSSIGINNSVALWVETIWEPKIFHCIDRVYISASPSAGVSDKYCCASFVTSGVIVIVECAHSYLMLTPEDPETFVTEITKALAQCGEEAITDDNGNININTTDLEAPIVGRWA